MGKPLRRGEEEAIGRRLEAAGVPIHYRLTGDALAEAGDCLWLDAHTLAIGLGFRTNWAGLEQIEEALGPEVVVVPVELPYYTGPEACLHLMSFISMLDHDLAVGYLPLIPVPFWQRLQSRGICLVEVPDAEFSAMAANVLAVAPRQCVMLEGSPVTRARLEAAGCAVRTYRGSEISLKAEGGPTCLTRPVWRAAVAV
jgi:N-dimethylarginine dimethylaminohydrolase